MCVRGGLGFFKGAMWDGIVRDASGYPIRITEFYRGGYGLPNLQAQWLAQYNWAAGMLVGAKLLLVVAIIAVIMEFWPKKKVPLEAQTFMPWELEEIRADFQKHLGGMTSSELLEAYGTTSIPDIMSIYAEVEFKLGTELWTYPSAPGNQLDFVNQMDRWELMSVSGIGALTADRIIALRNLQGSFASIDELKNVAGIGPSTISNLRAWLAGMGIVDEE